MTTLESEISVLLERGKITSDLYAVCREIFSGPFLEGIYTAQLGRVPSIDISPVKDQLSLVWEYPYYIRIGIWATVRYPAHWEYVISSLDDTVRVEYSNIIPVSERGKFFWEAVCQNGSPQDILFRYPTDHDVPLGDTVCNVEIPPVNLPLLQLELETVKASVDLLKVEGEALQQQLWVLSLERCLQEAVNLFAEPKSQPKPGVYDFRCSEVQFEEWLRVTQSVLAGDHIAGVEKI